tara:strand:+ start:338 stop:802 length:465 start_codon:yes stop_codon:yes gene_type:complete
MKFIAERANSKFVLNRFLPNSSLVSMLSIFFLFYGCGKKRVINTDQLISMQYAIGEEIPYTGLAIELYDNGKIKYEYQYENGLLNGSCISYYENGNKKQVGEYLNNKLNGNYIDYHENGNIALQGRYMNSKKNGVWNLYDLDGKKLVAYNYVNN